MKLLWITIGPIIVPNDNNEWIDNYIIKYLILIFVLITEILEILLKD